MISYVEERTGMNFKGRPRVKILKNYAFFPVEVRLGAHGTLHMDDEAARALLVQLQQALTPTAKRGGA